MRLNEVRSKYFEFFEKRGHTVIPSASIVPENDPTTLFTGSGMQPLLPFLLGETHPQGTRLVDSQKCLRSEDIEEVGDNRHTTFFEMLGNWSFGDYFKKEQLLWFFEFLTKEVGLDPRRLYVTVFSGDTKKGIPQDIESAEIWKKIFKSVGIDAEVATIGSEEDGYRRGIKESERIFYYDAQKNWWSRSGIPENMPVKEPGGPDSEVFYDFGTPHNTSLGKNCHPNCDCGRFMEIGNSVFMQYQKREDGTFSELPQRNVDFGGGLERIVAASNNNPDIFLVDGLCDITQQIEEWSEKKYNEDAFKVSFRIIADHIRASVFMINDGVLPSNSEQGYLLRRLLRRAILHGDKIGIESNTLHLLVQNLATVYSQTYTNLKNHKNSRHISVTIQEEEEKFRKTLKRGLREFEKLGSHHISGKDAFTLFSTYGFPIEITEEMAIERGISIDVEGFKKEAKMHQEESRAGAEHKFKGGLIDHSEMSVKYHTATHLLHKALRDVLGGHVTQKGSNITPERLRFDFIHNSKLTDDQKKEVEEIVNRKIKEDLPISYEDLSQEDAAKKGAIGLFEEKYGNTVRVYTIGQPGNTFSLEYCGGPHVKSTSELGSFRIKKEEAVSAGVRRIKAVLE